MKVHQIYQLLDAIAPFDSQEEWDNSGLLVGDPDQEITAVLFALDVTEAVLAQAEQEGAGLIVTHHPLMFSPRRRLTEEDFEGRLIRRMIRGNMAHIAAHTNLDKAQGGMNDALAACCGLQEVRGEGFFRCGVLPEPMAAEAFAARLREVLGDSVRLMGPGDATVHRIGLCTGGGSQEWEAAAAYGCDGYISGEIKHHHALAMADAGIAAFECGHYATEMPGLQVLADALQNALDTVEYNLRIFMSAQDAYPIPHTRGRRFTCQKEVPDGKV